MKGSIHVSVGGTGSCCVQFISDYELSPTELEESTTCSSAEVQDTALWRQLAVS